MKIKTISATALVLWGLAPSCGLAEPTLETKQMAVTDLFPFLDKYYALPPRERDHFHLVYAMSGGGITAMHAILKRPGGNVPIVISQAGAMTPVPTAEDVTARTPISASAPKGTKIRMTVKLAVTMEPAQVMDAKALKVGIDQAAQSSKKAAGLIALAVPNFQRVCFAGASSGSAILADGKSVPLKVTAKAPGKPDGLPCFTPDEQPTAVRISLDHVPSDLFILPK